MPTLQTPTGYLSYKSFNGKLLSLVWGDTYENQPEDFNISKELDLYFQGKLRDFSMQVLPEGTAYQQKVWQALLTIPYGEVRTYKDIAEQIGSHARAVGSAVGKNPIPIIIPCHRVLGSNGSLTGFSGGEGITTKKQLLDLEQNNT
jgi:methylated-DNA-[protein]-cysteine S-methyltransferase